MNAKTIAALLILASAASAHAQDDKHPNDKCPPGNHTVNIERQVCTDVKPGGVGGGICHTEKTEVCRTNAGSGVQEASKTSRP